MPTINLSDAFGLNIDGKLSEGAKLPSIFPRFLHIKDTPLDQIPVDELSAGLSFQQPVPVPGDLLSLTVGASGGGRVAIIGPGKPALDPDDPFSSIGVSADEAYLALGLDFSLHAGASGGAEPGFFGVDLDKQLSLKCYRRFVRSAGGFPPFGRAFGVALSSCSIPARAEDLKSIDTEVVLVAAGTGSLTVSGGFSFSTPIQTLASVPLPAGAELDVRHGGSFSVNAAVTISAGYQIRIRRLLSGNIELGVYNVKSAESELGISAQAGISASVASFDLAEKFIEAVSNKPLVDVKEFTDALPGEDDDAKIQRIKGFENSLKPAISTQIRASVQVALSKLRVDDAAWLFEIDLEKATDARSSAMLTAALRGDFSGLTADPNTLPDGITQKVNILSQTNVTRRSIRVNLLGLVNLLSVTRTTAVSTTELDGSGAITLITDTASESRLRALLVNTGGDAKRLRKFLSENFLIEAAYHVTDLGILPPEFEARHTYFELHDRTSRAEMKDNLDVARLLGMIDRSEQQRRLLDRRQFGRTTLYAEARYTNQALRRAFLDETGSPRSIDDYESRGRSALNALLSGDEGQELRRRYADPTPVGNKLWKEMKRVGNVTSFGPLFGFPKDSQNPRVNAIGADYLAITSWAKAMNATGLAIQEVEREFSGGRNPEDATTSQARLLLKKRLIEVVRQTGEHFGDPLGMMMVYLASNMDAARTVVVAGDEIERLEATSSDGLTRTAHG